MAEDVYKKFQKAKLRFYDFRQKLVVRVWNMAKRLDPKKMRREKKK